LDYGLHVILLLGMFPSPILGLWLIGQIPVLLCILAITLVKGVNVFKGTAIPLREMENAAGRIVEVHE